MEPSQAARAWLPAGSLLGVVPPTRTRFYTGLRAGQVSRMPENPAVRIQSKQSEGMSNIWLWKTAIRRWGQLLCLAHSV